MRSPPGRHRQEPLAGHGGRHTASTARAARPRKTQPAKWRSPASRPSTRGRARHTLPSAKPLAMCLRTNQITSAPGINVRVPAAVSRPQSSPEALTVRVIVAAIGLALTDVSVRAKSNSTQLNMKQKKAATPDPAADQREEDLDEEAPVAVAVDERRLVDRPGHGGHEPLEDPHGERHVEQHVGEGDGDGVSNRPTFW